MRRLWTDHVIWTRMYVVAAAAGAPVSERLVSALGDVVGTIAPPLGGIVSTIGDGDAAAVRLLKNQEDIGNAVVPFYGAAAGKKLTALLKEHILIAVELVAAARDGDTARFEREDAKWSKNAEQIAEFLSAANPHWSKADLVDLLAQHLALTKQEASARLAQNWPADIEMFDQLFTEILTVAEALSTGLIKQFPDRLAGSNGTTPAALSLRLALARLWADHVIWTRQYILSALAGTPDAEPVAARLLKNQDDIGAAVVPLYGAEAGRALTDLLKRHITIAVDIIDAAKNSDDARFKAANQEWDRNVEEIAAFLSSANPNWPQADLVDLLRQHLNLTRNEVTARLHKKRADEVEAFDQILTEILTVSDTLASGIVKQFPDKFVQ